LTKLRVLALVKEILESDPVLDEADVLPLEFRRVVITAHPAEHDDRDRRDHQVTINLVSNPVEIFAPLEGLLLALGVKAKLPHRRTTLDAHRR
jgi:hypothetical protein